MTDIFISYARSTAAQAQVVAEALRRLGYGVWRDDELPAHRAYAEVIEERLRAARAVVVVWSAEAVKSQWVRAEANLAREAGTLVQLRVDDCTLPLPFNEIQCADLSGWTGNPDAPGWQRVLESVDHLCGKERAQPAPVASVPSPVSPPTSLRSMLKKPVVLGGLAAAGVAAVALLGVTLMRAPSAPAANQRIAFFGYTVDGNDPSGASTALAKSATDKMFQSLRAFRLDAAAPTETLDTPKDKRFAKAAAVGARYALSGEVRTEGAQSVLALRVEDVASHASLWEKSFSGPLNESVFLPAMAAKASNRTMLCIVAWRRPAHETPKFIQLVADVCKDGGRVQDGIQSAGEMVSKTRELTQAEPDFAAAHAKLADYLSILALVSSHSARPPLIAEAEAALARAVKLDPSDSEADVEADIAAAKGLPLADYEAIIHNAVPKIHKSDAHRYSQAIVAYHEILLTVGRRRESIDVLAEIAANDPGELGGALGFAYAVNGQSATARAQFETGMADDPSFDVWERWVLCAIFFGAGDVDALLKTPPWFVTRGTVDCLRDIQKANVSSAQTARRRGTQRADECATRGELAAQESVLVPSALGDVDGTILAMERAPKMDSTTFGDSNTPSLFWPQTRAVRADPRFLPMVERLGLMDYWRTTKTQPDVCETEDVPFCRELKKTLATKH